MEKVRKWRDMKEKREGKEENGEGEKKRKKWRDREIKTIPGQ